MEGQAQRLETDNQRQTALDERKTHAADLATPVPAEHPQQGQDTTSSLALPLHPTIRMARAYLAHLEPTPGVFVEGPLGPYYLEA